MLRFVKAIILLTSIEQAKANHCMTAIIITNLDAEKVTGLPCRHPCANFNFSIAYAFTESGGEPCRLNRIDDLGSSDIGDGDAVGEVG